MLHNFPIELGLCARHTSVMKKIRKPKAQPYKCNKNTIWSTSNCNCKQTTKKNIEVSGTKSRATSVMTMRLLTAFAMTMKNNFLQLATKRTMILQNSCFSIFTNALLLQSGYATTMQLDGGFVLQMRCGSSCREVGHELIAQWRRDG